MQPTNNNGSIIIRFTKFRHKYSLTNLGKFDDATAIASAWQICKAILGDMNIGRFKPKNNDELFAAYHPLANLSHHHDESSKAMDCLQSVEQKIAGQNLRDRNLYQTKNFLTRYGKPIKSSDDAVKSWQWLQGESKGNSRTINRHLESLKPICPHFRDIPKLKTSQTKHEKPFSIDEIARILTAFDEHFPHYKAFVQFLLSTGCRPNEATAIKWKYIDFERNSISISNP
jgi:Phage integrase family